MKQKLSNVILTMMAFLASLVVNAASKPEAILGISIVGNKESPRVLTIVPWRQPLANGEDPKVIQIWSPEMNLLDPDAFRRDIDLFLSQRDQRLGTTQEGDKK